MCAYQTDKWVKEVGSSSLVVYKNIISSRSTLSDRDACRLFLFSMLEAQDTVVARKFGPPLCTTEWARAKRFAGEETNSKEFAGVWKDVFNTMKAVDIHAPSLDACENQDGYRDFWKLKEHLHGSMKELVKPSLWTTLYIMSTHCNALELWREVVGRTPDLFMMSLQSYVHTHAGGNVSLGVKSAIADTL
jgi:hypothetical protein